MARVADWASNHRAAAVAIAAVTLITVSAGVLILLLLTDADGNITPASALASLDRRDFARAAFEAEQLAKSGQGPTPQRSAAAFILGAVELYRAESSPTNLVSQYALSAASYLEQSRRWGFPTGRHSQGHALLGRSQFLIGNYPEALTSLQEALAHGAEPAEELHRLAAQACLRLPTPLPRVALDHLRACTNIKGIAAADRHRAIVQQAQVLFALEEYDHCRKTLESLPPRERAIGEAALLSGRLYLVQAEQPPQGGGPAGASEPQSPLPDSKPGDEPADNSSGEDADEVDPQPAVPPTEKARQLYEQAVETFRTALLHRTTDPRLAAELNYGLAQAYYGLGDHAAALRQLRRIQSGFAVEDVAFKAALDEGELLFDRRDYAGLVNAHRQVVERMPAVTPGNTSPLADELRQRCLANVQRLMEAEAFAEAVELIRASEALLPPVERWSNLASTYEAWGEHLMAAALHAEERAKKFRQDGGNLQAAQSRNTSSDSPVGEVSEAPATTPIAETNSTNGGMAQSGPDASRLVSSPGPLWLSAIESGQAREFLTPGGSPRARQLIGDARECFRQAGRAYERLAEIRYPTSHYPDDLWAAAEAFHQARDYPATIRLLRAYLEHARPHSRQPEALMRLGEAWLAEGNGEEAVQALSDVLILYPRHPAKYAARLLLAQAYLELGEADKAADQLQANLEGDDLTPASPEWRAALFALGQLKYGQQQWEQAARLLEQAVARYPESPLAATANYLLGECYLKLSRERANEVVPPLAAAERARADAERNLQAKALEALNQARQMLERQASEAELTLLQESILRNTYFARAAILKQLGRLDDSLDTYTALINRYQHSPAVLDAYAQAAAIYRQQRQTAKAQNAIAAAQSVLKRLPDDGLVKDLTGQSKEEWTRYLAWLADL